MFHTVLVYSYQITTQSLSSSNCNYQHSSFTMPSATPQRIVIIGGGFSGTLSALAARRLISLHGQDEHIEVVLIAPEQRLAIRPRLYEEKPETLAAPLDKLFKATKVRFVQGKVRKIRTSDREIDIELSEAQKSVMRYDRLILAAGSHLNTPNVAGLREHAFDVDQLENAEKLDQHLHTLPKKPSSIARNTVVVCGGGFTGIELAAELPARLRDILGKDTKFRVVIIDRNADIGPGLGPGPRPAILQAFKDLNVEMKLGAAVTAIDANGVTTSTSERIEASTVVWTGGMVATGLAAQIPGDHDQLGRVIVDSNLRAPQAEDVFVTGDAACAATDDIGHTNLMSCQHALVLGRSSGHNAAADLLQLPNEPYSQPQYGTCLALGGYGAVVTQGWDREVVYTGQQAKFVKTWINTVLIYPPKPDVAEAFAFADPAYTIPPLEPPAIEAKV